MPISAAAAALAGVLLAAQGFAADVATEIELRLAAPVIPMWVVPDGRSAAQWSTLQRFYKDRSFAPAWIEDAGLRPQALELLQGLREAGAEGLEADRYLASPAIRAAFDAPPQWPTAAADRDLQLSYVFLRLAQDMLEGRLSPRGASAYWAAAPTAETDGPRLLRAAAEDRGPRAVLAALAPAHAQYAALLRTLDEHRAIAAAGGWPQVPALASPRLARKDPRLSVLRQRLAISGDLQPLPERATPALSDRLLAAALKRFQSRHGLAPDGRLGAATLAALNMTVEDRIAQIELNLERWRWLPQQLGPRYVLVNVPAFELHAVDGGSTAVRMKVVTGASGETPTPIFSAAITSVIFSPWWNVPPRIAEEEIVPAMQRSRGYLRKRGLQVVAGESAVQFRQPPGPTNPMGLVKFLLPNPFNVYLHDTPNDAAFARARRDLSHGCMRVEHPLALARWALQDGAAWPDTQIRGAMNAGTERAVSLGAEVPVHVVYFTVWVEEDGSARFLPDVYGHDEAQLALMRGQGPWQRMAQAAAVPASGP